MELNEENWFEFAAQSYNENPLELRDDLKTISFVKRLLKRHCVTHGPLIVNHLKLLRNVFGTEAAAKLLLFRIDAKYHHVLLPYLKDMKC